MYGVDTWKQEQNFLWLRRTYYIFNLTDNEELFWKGVDGLSCSIVKEYPLMWFYNVYQIFYINIFSYTRLGLL